jgi:hypothetical protein
LEVCSLRFCELLVFLSVEARAVEYPGAGEIGVAEVLEAGVVGVVVVVALVAAAPLVIGEGFTFYEKKIILCRYL